MDGVDCAKRIEWVSSSCLTIVVVEAALHVTSVAFFTAICGARRSRLTESFVAAAVDRTKRRTPDDDDDDALSSCFCPSSKGVGGEETAAVVFGAVPKTR